MKVQSPAYILIDIDYFPQEKILHEMKVSL